MDISKLPLQLTIDYTLQADVETGVVQSISGKTAKKLVVSGLTINGPLKYTLGDQVDGYVLTLVDGVAVWQPATNGGTGTSGTSGVSGTSGISGTNGTSGTSGVNGSAGTSGTSGVNGSAGTSGTSGVNGSAGTSGIDGSAADQGHWVNGDSQVINAGKIVTIGSDYVMVDSALEIQGAESDGYGSTITISGKTYSRNGKLSVFGDLVLNTMDVVNDGEIRVDKGLILDGEVSITGNGIII